MPPLVAQARAPQLWWRHSCDIWDKPAVTTATTYSTIDETPLPFIFVASVFEVVVMRKECVRSQFGLSSNQSCAASGGKPTQNAKIFCLC